MKVVFEKTVKWAHSKKSTWVESTARRVLSDSGALARRAGPQALWMHPAPLLRISLSKSHRLGSLSFPELMHPPTSCSRVSSPHNPWTLWWKPLKFDMKTLEHYGRSSGCPPRFSRTMLGRVLLLDWMFWSMRFGSCQTVDPKFLPPWLKGALGSPPVQGPPHACLSKPYSALHIIV